jgi:hypothetical protein
MSIFPETDTQPITESEGEFNSEPDSDVNMRMEDVMNMPDCVNWAGDVDLE